MARQLFYGKLSSVSPVGNGSNSYIRVRFDATTDSTTLTNVTDVTGYFGIDEVRVGQQLVESSAFPTGTTITAVDVGNQTITVEDNPATVENQGLGRISPAEGDYFIPSASLTDPQGLIDFRNITGSDDSEFESGDTIYAILGQAADSSQNTIVGRFHKYTISEVFYRNPSGAEGSIYVKWGEKGTQADSGDELSESSNQAIAIVQLTPSESLAPIFTRNLTGIQDLNTGQETAAFQIEVQDFLDDLVTTNVLQTGSLVAGNIATLNFSGSGVQVDASGSDGVVVRIDGGGSGSGTSGSSGSSGTSGSSGSSGTSGSSGSSGTSGSSGSSGTSGSSGSSGTSGIDGSSGSSGTSGSDGSSGSSGTSGSSGSSGTSGSSGSSGTSGIDGSSGSSGTSGSSGSSGTSGSDGSSGSSGTSGSSGSSGTSGSSGSSGSSGTSGLDGSSGSSGTSGSDGSSGSSGTSGLDGSSGSSGTSGSDGSSGSSGTSGSSGSSGTSGSSGSSGTSGSDGSSGSSGTSGSDGSSGSSGTSGSSGSSGTSGIDGSSGSSGTSGSSGSSGTSGSSGSSGTSGIDGSSGSSGTSGSSGSSGTSGTSPTIANDADNRITTALGDGTLNAEENLTFDGSIITQNTEYERRTSEITVNAGNTSNLISVSTTNYLGLVIDYTLLGNDGRARFGTVRAIFDSSSIIIDEVTSTDLNDVTDAITFAGTTGANAAITVDNPTGSGFNVTIKAFINLIER